MVDARQWQQQLLDAICHPHDPQTSAFPAAALAVYRNNYRVGLMDMLAIVYPIVRQLVGDPFFSGLSRELVRVTPSRSGNLHRYGEEMADFIRQFPPAADLPYLPDVARMEWLLHRGYYAADHCPCDTSRLAATDPSRWGLLRFGVHAALLHSPWALSRIHAYHQPGADESPFNLQQEEYLLLWRQHGTMQLRTLDAASYAWLAALQQGLTLDEATQAALQVAADFDLQRLLIDSLQGGWLSLEEGSTP